MDEGQVLYYLDIWKDYMQSMGSGKLGYPSKSAGFLSGGIHSVEDLEDSIDVSTAQIVDKCIDALSPIERTAINVRWLNERTLINPIMIDTHYGVAVSKLEKKLQEKGLY